MVGGGSDGLWVDGLSGVGDLGHVTLEVVGVVGDGLDAAVGEVHLVGALDDTCAVVGLGSVEVGLAVVVSDGVGVGVGGDLVGVDLGGVVGGGGVHNRGGVVGRGGMVGRGGVGDGVHKGSVVSHGVVGDGVGDAMVGQAVVGQAVVGHSVVGHGVSHGVVGDVVAATQDDVGGSGEELGGGHGGADKGEEGQALKGGVRGEAEE